MIKVLLRFGLLYSLCAVANAQGFNTYHVFPQVADGKFTDGSYYRSTVFATNINTVPATCRYQSYGLGTDRIQLGDSFTIPANGGVTRAVSSGSAAFAAGYGTLTCDHPVQAYMQYEFLSPGSLILGTATVFSAPATSAAEFIFPVAAAYRLGLAIANDSDSTAILDVRIGAAGNEELSTTVTVPPRTRIARFVDELVQIPSNFIPVAALVQSSATTPSAQFEAIGLIYSGVTYSTVPPLIFH